MEEQQANLFGEEPSRAAPRRRSARTASALSPSLALDIEQIDAMLVQAVTELELPRPRHPLQCVTYKAPLRQHQRLTRAAKAYELAYSDLLRFATLHITVALEKPSPELREKLERHRERVLARRAARAAKRGFHTECAA